MKNFYGKGILKFIAGFMVFFVGIGLYACGEKTTDSDTVTEGNDIYDSDSQGGEISDGEIEMVSDGARSANWSLTYSIESGIKKGSVKFGYCGDNLTEANKSWYNLKSDGIEEYSSTLILPALKSQNYRASSQCGADKFGYINFNLKNGEALPDWPQDSKLDDEALADYAYADNNFSNAAGFLVFTYTKESGALFWKSTQEYRVFVYIYAFKYDDIIQWENAEASAYDSNTDNWGPLSLKYSVLPNNSEYELVSPVYFQWGSGVQSGRNIYEFGEKMGISSYEVQDGYLEGIHETIFLRGSFPRDKDSWLRFATIYDTCPVDRTLTICPDKAVGKVEFMRVKIYGLENAKKKTLGQALRKSYYENALIGFIIQDKNGNKKVCFMKFGVFGELIDQY